ncbi:unnamed protein product [Lepeophtheirus salmonis]|uniref:(salmon louse) hypothetical protein n=1 Tax=Lepeophtheirus salmonis TaxID=72036 RepID=A0A7R8CTR2_LEPSM|nr:unnamed protein product [Lepeophtheirus salmonis]CAF2927529.1 unnamed protein product [Lepeophtheirus salmonis]
MNDKIKAEHLGHPLIPCHCVIHQEKPEGFTTHRQFLELLADLETEYLDVLYQNHVRWLSLGKVFRRMWELREETVMFLEMKSIQCDFSTNVFDEDWRLDFKFAIDIMEKS